MTAEATATSEDFLATQPHAVVERDGVRYTLLGTAHVSRASIDAVKEAIGTGRYDAVAVELDPPRLQALTDPDALAKLDLIQVIRTGRVAMFAANLALSAYQRRLAEQLGIEPGAELKQAVLEARERNLPVHLIDREVGLTFKRAAAKLGFWGRMKLGSGLVASLFADDEVGAEDIEKLKQGDMLEASFSEFATSSPELYESVIAERDRYMAARLRETHGDAREVLAVVGAGHLQGLAKHLREETREPEALRTELEQVKSKRKIPWITLCIMALIIAGIGWGFWRGGWAAGSDLLMQWVLFTGGFAALGCVLAGGHPFSVIAAALVAPLKPFRPGVPVGAVSALIEAQRRKPAYGDFLALRHDAQTVRGWYHNRVTRVVLNFMLTNLGMTLGFWISGFTIWSKLAG
ncbi:TraB/GumN family protein [Lysobacter solisilvae (ex Woo and Kim 2020)]|uniref:TraB/GumN family protein n=1 Tax=Agrilutibacter terrestris TaxID=2865112 RepID=A0A7H0FX67_9GAMM|nr:TraB/GumN family protein [Lysobacter terrestris]QNP40633.1 TraB/GumN family protein [Lysobacter terrestris]